MAKQVIIDETSLVELYDMIDHYFERSFKDLFLAKYKIFIENAVFDRFENIEITTKTLCELWKVDNTTITAYIRNGIVKPINPGSAKHLFNLKDVLQIENPKWRRIGK